MKSPSQVRPLPVTAPALPGYVQGPAVPALSEWQGIAEAYESNPGSLRNAWLYLGHHPAFWTLSERVGGYHVASGAGWYQAIETGVDEDGFVWIEVQPAYWPEDPTEEEFHAAAPHMPPHDIDICADTYELAVVYAAATVHQRYGNDREFLKIHRLNEERWYG